MLTATHARNAKPKATSYSLADAGGLRLLIRPTGTKAWQYRYRYGGRENVFTIGPYPAVSLAEARGHRDQAKALLRQGKDPNIEKRQDRLTVAATTANSFEKVARDWHDTMKSRWSTTHTNDVIHSLERDVFPMIGDVPIENIVGTMILSTLRPVIKRPAVETARRIHQRIRSIFGYAMANGQVSDNPATRIEEALPPVPRSGQQPAITNITELRSMLNTIERMPAHPITKLCNRFMAITAARPGAVYGIRWTELSGLDSANPVWEIPGERMKNGNPFAIPLPAQATEIVAAARRLTGRCPFVFPNLRHAHQPMTHGAPYMLFRRAGFEGRHCPHGWRASFSTILNELYLSDGHIIDFALAHVEKDKVKGAYNRAKYMSRRRELHQEWANMLLDGFPAANNLLAGRRR